MDPVPVLVISGPPGVGKTTVVWEVLSRATELNEAPAMADLDLLDAAWPAPEDDPFQHRLKARNLAAVEGAQPRLNQTTLTTAAAAIPSRVGCRGARNRVPLPGGRRGKYHIVGRVEGMKSLRRPDRFPLSSNYDPDWVLGLDMGPHPLWQLEDLMAHLQVQPGDRVLDLGCGRGATSVFLAREFDLQVVAVDRWVVESALGTDRTGHRCDGLDATRQPRRLGHLGESGGRERQQPLAHHADLGGA